MSKKIDPFIVDYLSNDNLYIPCYYHLKKQKERNEVVQFKDGNFVLDVNVSSNGETVWLTLDQMSKLFNKNKSTISRHIANIFNEKELDEKNSVAKNATQLKRYDPRTKKDRITVVDVNYYNLDVINSITYRDNNI